MIKLLNILLEIEIILNIRPKVGNYYWIHYNGVDTGWRITKVTEINDEGHIRTVSGKFYNELKVLGYWPNIESWNIHAKEGLIKHYSNKKPHPLNEIQIGVTSDDVEDLRKEIVRLVSYKNVDEQWWTEHYWQLFDDYGYENNYTKGLPGWFPTLPSQKLYKLYNDMFKLKTQLENDEI